jgi:predicted site-specific integrase-resolvase
VTGRATKLASIPIHERFLLDEETASIMCGVCLDTFRAWRKAGHVRCVKLPIGDRRKLYRRSDLVEFVESLGVAI